MHFQLPPPPRDPQFKVGLPPPGEHSLVIDLSTWMMNEQVRTTNKDRRRISKGGEGGISSSGAPTAKKNPPLNFLGDLIIVFVFGQMIVWNELEIFIFFSRVGILDLLTLFDRVKDFFSLWCCTCTYIRASEYQP